jgi:ketosteroid isomerase-like protein
VSGLRASLVLCLAFLSLPAQAADNLASVDQEWLLAYNDRDGGPVRRIWSEDARLVATTGRVKSKTEEIEDVTGPEPPELKAKWSVTDQIVREYGDTGVVIGRFAQKGTWSGQPFERPYRYTNVYAKIGGEWRMVSSHWSKISD